MTRIADCSSVANVSVPRTARTLVAQIVIGAGLLALCQAPATADEDAAKSPAGDPPAAGKVDLTFSTLGAQAGERLPLLILRTIEGGEQPLADAWRERPALLLTSSLTCPKLRSRWPDMAKIAAKYGTKVNVVVLYVIEAHPDRDICPYKGVVDVTEENLRDDILRRQPATLDERLKLAADFKKRLDVNVPIYVDGLDNVAWKALGGGPNMAILVRDGVVVTRQGWFAAGELRSEIDDLLDTPKAPKRQPDRDELDEVEAKYQAAGVRPMEVARLIEAGKAGAFAKLLDRLPELATYPKPYHYIGQGFTEGMCMLPWASEKGQVEIIELLLVRGADINLQNDRVPGRSTRLPQRAKPRPWKSCSPTRPILICAPRWA